MIDKIIDFIDKVERNNLTYYIFGGIALDAMRGRLTREHGDIDIVAPLGQKDLFLGLLYSEDFEVDWRSGEFYRASRNGFSVDVLFYNKEEDMIVVDGAKAKYSVPKELFERVNKGKINGKEFNLASLEYLFGTLYCYDHEADREFLMGLKDNVNIEEIRRIKNTIKDLPNYPKGRIHEERKKELIARGII